MYVHLSSNTVISKITFVITFVFINTSCRRLYSFHFSTRFLIMAYHLLDTKYINIKWNVDSTCKKQNSKWEWTFIYSEIIFLLFINLFQIKECKPFQVTKRIKYKSAEKMHNPRFFSAMIAILKKHFNVYIFCFILLFMFYPFFYQINKLNVKSKKNSVNYS